MNKTQTAKLQAFAKERGFKNPLELISGYEKLEHQLVVSENKLAPLVANSSGAARIYNERQLHLSRSDRRVIDDVAHNSNGNQLVRVAVALITGADESMVS